MRLEKSARNEIIETSPYFQTLLHHFWLTYFVKKKKKKVIMKIICSLLTERSPPLVAQHFGRPLKKGVLTTQCAGAAYPIVI